MRITAIVAKKHRLDPGLSQRCHWGCALPSQGAWELHTADRRGYRKWSQTGTIAQQQSRATPPISFAPFLKCSGCTCYLIPTENHEVRACFVAEHALHGLHCQRLDFVVLSNMEANELHDNERVVVLVVEIHVCFGGLCTVD